MCDCDVKMRATDTNETNLVIAAQAGDRRALEELVATSLPLVYAIVRRALSGHPDADDVVQDTMLRAMRRLPALHSPESLRPWLAAIAVHQVSTYLHRQRLSARRTVALDEAAELADSGAEFEDLTMLRLELSGQRRQVVRASRWLDPDDAALLSLWWLEAAGELTRTDLAAALGVSVAHAGVRVQRMRHQLDLCRELVAALDARPRCAVLDAVAAHWDGTPSPRWRKRLGRHTRPCGVCAQAAEGMIAADRLLVGFALLPVPVGLAAALLGKTAVAAAATVTMQATLAGAAGTAGSGASGGVSAGVKAGLLGQLVQAILAHPIAATIAAGAVAAAVVTATTLPAPPSPSSGIRAAPSPTHAARPTPVIAAPTRKPAPSTAASPSVTVAGSLTLGRPVSLESTAEAGQYVSAVDSLGVLTPFGADSANGTRRQATFTVIAGLANASCYSFRSPDGRYLRHASWRLRLNPDEGTPLFRADATFCVRTGATADSIALEASNYPGWFVHHRGDQLWVDQSDGSVGFRAESSFRVRPALAD